MAVLRSHERISEMRLVKETATELVHEIDDDEPLISGQVEQFKPILDKLVNEIERLMWLEIDHYDGGDLKALFRRIRGE